MVLILSLDNPADTRGTTSFSGRREGFVLYFARLVRPAWKAKLTKIGYDDTFCHRSF